METRLQKLFEIKNIGVKASFYSQGIHITIRPQCVCDEFTTSYARKLYFNQCQGSKEFTSDRK